jgi:DNA-directed RNA polymerase
LFGEIKVITSDESVAYLEYKKMEVSRLDKRYKTVRTTVLFQNLSDELDLRKSYQALRPNLLHSVDATFVRLILTTLQNPIITIHDSFGMDIFNVDSLIIVANRVINLIASEVNEDVEKNNIIFKSKFILI